MKQTTGLWIVGPGLLVSLFLATSAINQQPTQGQLIEEGKQLYERYCALCHGPEGRGDGEMAYLLYPKPRDLREGIYKIRSTPTGMLPTDQDLFRVISNGMPGTAMPPWKGTLNERQRWALVQSIKTFSPRFREERQPAPIKISAPPPPTSPLLQLGKRIYLRQGCGQCHGAGGRGDGPSSATLRDNWGYPSLPYDFTQPARFKGGNAPRDIYRTFMTGMDGTPMPSYTGTLNEREAWALTYYVLSLVRKQPVLPEVGHVITARHVSALPPLEAPFHPGWRQAKPVAIPVRPLWDRLTPFDRVFVRALHDGKHLMIMIEWKDPLPADFYVRPQDFRDAVAVQFPVGKGQSLLPFYGMGDQKQPVNIWQWRADWQADMVRFRDLEAVYPDMVHDLYLFANDSTYVPARKIGNLNAQLVRLTPVEDLNAVGPTSLTAQLAEEQNVAGLGLRYNGAWHVVFIRALQSPDSHDAQFTPGRDSPIAFAVWNGEAGDRNGQKSVTWWQTLRLEP